MNGPGRHLEDLNPAQREAVEATTGPLVILAGAGTGKTRTISRRAAYAIETGAVPADQILLVTFTEKAAREMAERMRALGHAGVMARTFHAAALAQLRHFWQLRRSEALPEVLDSKARLLVPIVGRLRAPYRFTPTRDVADAIEWAKVRGIGPGEWAARAAERSILPPDVFAAVYRDYERAKTRAGVLDFEDLLVRTVELLEADEDAAATVRRRKRWFSVDEYQDTNPLFEGLLTLWAGESHDVAVVGDPNQTIYTFTGATPEYLLTFEARHPGARRVVLPDNYRSTPQVLALANRLVAADPGVALRTTRSPGPAPVIQPLATDDAEAAWIVAEVRRLTASGTPPGEIAVLVRINAQLPPLEDALRRAGIPFTLRGGKFFERREVVAARRLLVRARPILDARGEALVDAIRSLFGAELGSPTDLDANAAGNEARERDASLELLLGILADEARTDPDLDVEGAIDVLDRRADGEASGAADGVNLLTYHRAKGLEWDAVFLPALEEGLLPIRHARDDAAIAEERRLLYVGITRARTHLALTWAWRRAGPGGKEGARRPSRFLDQLQPARAAPGRRAPVRDEAAGSKRSPIHITLGADGNPTFEALRAWRRERAATDGVPAYVVAHDSTLAAIAEARPISLAALRRIAGMGPARMERYGPEIVSVVTASARD